MMRPIYIKKFLDSRGSAIIEGLWSLTFLVIVFVALANLLTLTWKYFSEVLLWIPRPQ